MTEKHETINTYDLYKFGPIRIRIGRPPGGRMRIDGPGPGEDVLGRIRGDLVGYPGSVIYDP